MDSARSIDMDADSESSSEQLINGIEDEEGWEDAEDDREDVQIKSLFDDEHFETAREMLEYCKARYSFNIWELKHDLQLDFLDLVKLANYVRTEVKAGNSNPDVSANSIFEDERYLKPVLEDDALLYNLDDLFENDEYLSTNPLQAEVDSLREQLSQLQSQFAAFRLDVQKSLLSNLNLTTSETADDLIAPISNQDRLSRHSTYLGKPRTLHAEADADYFSSYTHPGIHRTMLTDTIRTDAYRDFIYDNKHLFAGRTVLDVGCGTGILSMFCAKAGAERVVAVDNSGIVEKARENVFKSGMDWDGKRGVRCLRGKVEELDLQSILGGDGKVDIIVSEWMGYCLLYESMLDSVIYARDKCLKTDGLMVPSHARIMIAPLVDSEVRIEQVDFWREVYGFDMSGMLERAFDEAIIQTVNPKEVGEGVVFRELDLHRAKVEDLSFTAPFELQWKDGTERLEGWVVWFDMFFATGRQDKAPVEVLGRKNAHEEGAKAFSTGPHVKQTHWNQGVLLMKDPIEGIAAGETIKGEVKYMKAGDGERSLDIQVEWHVPGKEKGKQTWKLE